MPYPYQDERQKPAPAHELGTALPRATEVTIPPASPHQKHPVTIGTYGPPEGAHQSLPVFRPVPGYKGGYPPGAGGAQGAGVPSSGRQAGDVPVPGFLQAPRISGVAPVQAAQAATPEGIPRPPANGMLGRPLSRTADGVFPYAYGEGGAQQGFAFRDPLTGQERGFATQEQAQAALGAGTASTPQAVTAARNDILQRAEQGRLSTGGIPQGAFNQQEQALLPGIARQVSLPAPVVTSPQTPVGAPLVGAQSADGVDVIRGTSVQRTGAGDGTAGAGSPVDLFREQLAASLQAAMEHGADMRQYLPQLEQLSKIEKNQAKDASGLPTLSQVQGQRFLDLAQNPDGITEADRLVFSRGGQAQGKKVDYKKPTYDQYGAQTGETPYTFDEKGNLKAVKLDGPYSPDYLGNDSRSDGGAGGQGAAPPPPSLGAFLAAARNDPRNAGVSDAELVNHYNQSYGQ